jgi:hypothetical protein
VRTLRLLAPVIAVVAVLAVPSTASATHYDVWYCGTLKAPEHWCGQPPYTGGHSWDQNTGYYFGSGNLYMCQRVYHPVFNAPLPGYSCGYPNYVSNYYGNVTCACYEAHVMQISGHNHTIWGFAEA